MKSSTVTIRGQVTIPLEIRDRLGVRPNDWLRLREIDNVEVRRA